MATNASAAIVKDDNQILTSGDARENNPKAQMKWPVKQQENTAAAAFPDLANTLNWHLPCHIISSPVAYYYCLI